MFELLPLAIVALSIALAAASLLGERLDGLQLAAGSPDGGLPLDPYVGEAVTLSGFDPRAEALLVQLPQEVFEDIDHADFATRPARNGAGQELLFRDRLLLRLPDLAPQQRIDLFVEPIPS